MLEIPYSFLTRRKQSTCVLKHFINCDCDATVLNLLVGEGQEDVLLCAHSTGHVLPLVVKFVVAGLGAANQLGQAFVLTVNRHYPS